jgi:MYXO-CTERM domain-containing protein
MPRPLRLAPLALLALALAPRPAQACDPDPCYDSDKWQQLDVVSEVVASDGVIFLDARRGDNADGLTDEEALAYLAVEVTQDGQPITGAVEVQDGWRGLVWRPDAPLTPGAALAITLTVDNDAIADDGCEPFGLELGPFAAEVGPDPLQSLDLAVATADAELSIREDETLDAYVCCDGAYPEIDTSCGDTIWWEEGHCEAITGVGWMRTTWTLNLADLPVELAGNLAWRVETETDTYLVWPGESQRTLSFDAPTCARAVVHNPATGETLELDEICLGDELAEDLGPQALDPSAGLAMCADEPYVCEHDGNAWDPAACEPYTGGDGDGDGDPTGDGDGDPTGDGDGDPTGDGDGGETGADAGLDGAEAGAGCSCSTGSSPAGPAALGLLVLLGLVRRRSV